MGLGRSIPKWVIIVVILSLLVGGSALAFQLKNYLFKTSVKEPFDVSKVDSLNLTYPGENDRVSLKVANKSDLAYGLLLDFDLESGENMFDRAACRNYYENGDSIQVYQEPRMWVENIKTDKNDDNDHLDEKIVLRGGEGAKCHFLIFTSKSGSSKENLKVNISLNRVEP